MADVLHWVSEAWQFYVNAALSPLMRLTWWTLSFVVGLVVLVTLVLQLVRSVVRPPKDTIPSAKVRTAGHKYAGYVRLSPEDYLTFHRLPSDTLTTSQKWHTLQKRDSDQYYVATIRDERRKAVIRKEVKLQTPPRAGRVKPGEFQLDEELIAVLQASGSDVETSEENKVQLLGPFGLHLRKVRWYDVRHWLTHPNREIRIAIWVTILTTGLPMLKDLLFG